MWRIALMSLAVLAVALSACEQEIQIAKPAAGELRDRGLVAD